MINYRIIKHIILFANYWLLTILFISFDDFVPTVDPTIILGITFSFINIAFAYILQKLTILRSLIIGIIIGTLSLCSALLLRELHSEFDMFGRIFTTLVSNTIFPIIYWEALYQFIKTQRNAR